jgi:hypothetical protein
MNIPRTYEIDEVVRCCAGVDRLCELLILEVPMVGGKDRKAMVEKAADRMAKRYDAVRGNRADGFPLTYADLRLLMAACLRDALKVLEEST